MCGMDQACDLGGQCMTTGGYWCDDIFDCIGDCPDNDDFCLQNCINVASIEAQMAFNNFYQCLADVDYWSCWDLCPAWAESITDCPDEGKDCFEQKMEMCEDEYYYCFPPGDMTCGEMYVCIMACDTDECVQDCFGEGSIEALDKWSLMIDCLDDAGYYDCGDFDEQCFDDAWAECEPEFDDCASGEASCGDIFTCFDSCAPTDEECTWNCMASATPEAQELYGLVIDCVYLVCGEDANWECMEMVLTADCAEIYEQCLAQ